MRGFPQVSDLRKPSFAFDEFIEVELSTHHREHHRRATASWIPENRPADRPACWLTRLRSPLERWMGHRS
jgi:hypothetical protein